MTVNLDLKTMKRRFLSFFFLPLLTLTLTGCLKLEIAYDVSSDGNVLNSYALMYEKEFLNEAGVTTLDEFVAGMEESQEQEADGAGDAAEPLLLGTDEKWVSQGIEYSETEKYFVIKESFTGAPGLTDEFLGIGLQDGKMVFYMDLTSASEDLSGEDAAVAALAGNFMPEATIALKMPGKILSYSEENATLIDEQTVTWSGKIDELGKLEASSEPDLGSGLNILIPISLTVIFLAIVGGVVFYLRKPREEVIAEEEQEENLQPS